MDDKIISLVPVGRADLFRQVLDQLMAFIDQNELKPGDRLPADRDLVTALQVSRPLVQQALKVLEGLGRVRIVHGSGTFVADDGLRVAAAEVIRGLPARHDVAAQLLHARETIERDLLKLAYAHARTALVADLRRVVEERKLQLADEPEEASLDLDFEATFAHHCGNPVMARLQAVLHHAWLQLQIEEARPLVDRYTLHEEHVAIFERLVAKDLEGALALFDAHMHHLDPSSSRAHRRR